MLARAPIQSDSNRCVRDGGQVLVESMAAALVILSIIIGLEISVTTARSGVEFSGKPSEEFVTPARKSDRLVMSPRIRLLNAMNQLRDLNPLRVPGLDSKLADGCEGLVSPLANPRLATVAGRCVS